MPRREDLQMSLGHRGVVSDNRVSLWDERGVTWRDDIHENSNHGITLASGNVAGADGSRVICTVIQSAMHTNGSLRTSPPILPFGSVSTFSERLVTRAQFPARKRQ